MKINSNKRSTILIITTLLVTSLVFTYLGLASSLQSGPPYNPEEREIYELREALKNRNLSDQMRHSLEEKLEIAERVVTQRVVGYPAPKDADKIPTLIPVTDPRPPTGIIDKIQEPFYSREVKIANLWQDFVNDELIQVAAGALTHDPSQGIVIVRNLTTQIGGMYYQIPNKTGTIYVAEANGTQLTLKTSQGETYFFDATELQLVSSLDEIIPPTRLLQYVTPTPRGATPSPYPAPP